MPIWVRAHDCVFLTFSGKKDKGSKDSASVVVNIDTLNITVQEEQQKADFVIQPEKVTPTLNTSEWPLLLKVRERFALLNLFRTMTS